jgi:hypothetical protein
MSAMASWFWRQVCDALALPPRADSITAELPQGIKQHRRMHAGTHLCDRPCSMGSPPRSRRALPLLSCLWLRLAAPGGLAAGLQPDQLPDHRSPLQNIRSNCIQRWALQWIGPEGRLSEAHHPRWQLICGYCWSAAPAREACDLLQRCVAVRAAGQLCSMVAARHQTSLRSVTRASAVTDPLGSSIIQVAGQIAGVCDPGVEVHMVERQSQRGATRPRSTA